MKGLMFNLLESLARDAGCSEEAWELVAEFAAADLLSDGVEVRTERLWGSDVHPSGAFEVPAEAMLSCLTRESRSDQSLDFGGRPSKRGLLSLEPPAGTLPELYDTIPKHALGGFGPGAFRRLAINLDFAGLDPDRGSASAEDDDWDDWHRPFQRPGSNDG